jgi:hypothetical protein
MEGAIMNQAKLTAAQLARLEQEQGREYLLTHYIKEGSTIYTTTRGVGHNYSLFIAQDNQIIEITYWVAQALGEKLSLSAGYRVIRQSGGGMDLAFNLVYNLSSVLFAGQDRAGYVLKQEKI